MKTRTYKAICTSLITVFYLSCFAQQKVGIFEGQTDVGNVLKPGKTTYNPKIQQYAMSGNGTNIWGTHDEFHYTWKKMKGDFILQLHGSLIGKGVDPHRKFGWMIRKSLDSSSAHISATVHGDGLTSLQFRKSDSAEMGEKQSPITSADIIQLERRGKKYIMSVARFGEPFTVTGISDIDLGDEVYAGIFLTSHNKDVIEKALFKNVRIIVPASDNFTPYKDYLGSHLELLDVSDGDRQIICTSPESLQAPNWLPDGKNLIYNSGGLIYKFSLEDKTPKILNTGSAKSNNNDHVLSMDGKMLGLSSTGSDPKSGSLVFTVPVTGGEPRQVTPSGPSYLHGWSPDKKFLIFTGLRKGEFDIYKVPAQGGQEVRLTYTKGLDDGSEFTPDGKYIYFNSVRSGTMQIWKMKADGSSQQQVTSDDYNNWFPHISPDGKWIAFISFMKDVDPSDHPFYKHVYIRLMPVSGGKPKIIAYVYGGQGTMNTPNWSPDSKKLAFISNTDVNKQ